MNRSFTMWRITQAEGVVLAAGLAILCWIFLRGLYRGYFSKSTDASPHKEQSVLNSGPPGALIDMPTATSRLFTYQDEQRAAQARQRLWIRYEDRAGHVTERIVEIYQPEDDEVLFTWCCLARAPRTFARRSIQSWRLLPDTFVFDPIINQYWEEEGTRDMDEKLPWRRWLDTQPAHIANRY